MQVSLKDNQIVIPLKAIPTLSELIKSCEDKIHQISIEWSAVTKSWCATMWFPPKQCEHSNTCQCGGLGEYKRAEWYDTPEEAVGRLYLALNKK